MTPHTAAQDASAEPPLSARRGGKTTAFEQATAEAVERGEHVHVYRIDGPPECHNGDCTWPIQGFPQPGTETAP